MFRFDYAVRRNRRPLDHLRRDHGTLLLLKDVHQLLEHRHFCIDDVVGKQGGKRFVADKFARGEHGVSQAQRLLLTYVGHVDHVGNLAHDLEQVELAFFFEHSFQLVADVEMIFDRALAAPRDHDDLIASRRQRLFHAILDDGLIDQRQHLFRLRFGGRKETGAQSGGRENRLCGRSRFLRRSLFVRRSWRRLHCGTIVTAGL